MKNLSLLLVLAAVVFSGCSRVSTLKPIGEVKALPAEDAAWLVGRWGPIMENEPTEKDKVKLAKGEGYYVAPNRDGKTFQFSWLKWDDEKQICVAQKGTLLFTEPTDWGLLGHVKFSRENDREPEMEVPSWFFARVRFFRPDNILEIAFPDEDVFKELVKSKRLAGHEADGELLLLASPKEIEALGKSESIKTIYNNSDRILLKRVSKQGAP